MKRLLKAFATLAAGAVTALAGLAQAQPMDPCALMRKADLETVLSRNFEAGIAGPVQAGTAKRAAVASCTYTSPAPQPRDLLSVSFMVRRSPEGMKGISLETAKAGAAQFKATPVDVPGLGDGAYWINLNTETSPNYQLNVMAGGGRYWLIVSTFGMRLEPAKAIPMLSTLARTAVSRL